MCEKEWGTIVCGINGPGGLYEWTGWGDKMDISQWYPWLAINYLVRGDYALKDEKPEVDEWGLEIKKEPCVTLWTAKESPWMLSWIDRCSE